MSDHKLLKILLCTAIAWLISQDARATDLDDKIADAADVINTFHAIPERGIPTALLERAYAIAVIPDMIKAGFVVAGRHGRGLISVRTDTGWSSPAFIKLTGGSVGWQAGVQAADLVLVFTNQRGVENLSRGKFTLGADAAVAAGPLGRNTSAATDHKLKAEVYSYSRARGLFAGVSIQGASLRIDNDANATFYVAPDISADDIFEGKVKITPESVVPFRQSLAAALAVNKIQTGVVGTDSSIPAEPTQSAEKESEPATTFALGERSANEQESDQD
ncbi:MAG: lipid-binding SYLF domain-containing protein [Pseudomonadota bacterium]